MKDLDNVIYWFEQTKNIIRFKVGTTANIQTIQSVISGLTKISSDLQQDFPFYAKRISELKQHLFMPNSLINVAVFGRIFELLIILKNNIEHQNNNRWKYIHPVLLQGQTKEKFQHGFYSDAVFTATKILMSRLKAMLHEADPQAKELDGSPLIENLMSEKAPKIMFSEGNTLLDKDLQRGYGALFKGWILAVRNQKAHGVTDTLTEEDAFQELVLISMLMKALDKSSVVIVQSQQADS